MVRNTPETLYRAAAVTMIVLETQFGRARRGRARHVVDLIFGEIDYNLALLPLPLRIQGSSLVTCQVDEIVIFSLNTKATSLHLSILLLRECVRILPKGLETLASNQ